MDSFSASRPWQALARVAREVRAGKARVRPRNPGREVRMKCRLSYSSMAEFTVKPDLDKGGEIPR